MSLVLSRKWMGPPRPGEQFFRIYVGNPPVSPAIHYGHLRHWSAHFAWPFVSLEPIRRHSTHPPLNGLAAVGRRIIVPPNNSVKHQSILVPASVSTKLRDLRVREFNWQAPNRLSFSDRIQLNGRCHLQRVNVTLQLCNNSPLPGQLCSLLWANKIRPQLRSRHWRQRQRCIRYRSPIMPKLSARPGSLV